MQAVIPLQYLIVRESEVEDKAGIFLVVPPPSLKPDLFTIKVPRAKEVVRVRCLLRHNKHMQVPQVVATLRKAHENAIKPVRRFEVGQSTAISKPLAITDEWIECDAWCQQLKGLFGRILSAMEETRNCAEMRKIAESSFGEYLLERIDWFERVRETIFENMPRMLDSIGGTGTGARC